MFRINNSYFQLCLTCVFVIVMQLGSHSNFVEISALLIQRALEEGHLDLVLQWGQTIFRFLARYEFWQATVRLK